MPGLAWHAANIDGGEHVLYDLANNPSKIAMLNALPTHLVEGEIKKLAASIKANQHAEANAKLPNEPFTQFKPSTGGVGKRPSEMSASDWAKHYKGKF
jgi:hypothetical protein